MRDRISVIMINYDVTIVGLVRCLERPDEIDHRPSETKSYKAVAPVMPILKPDACGMAETFKRVLHLFDRGKSNSSSDGKSDGIDVGNGNGEDSRGRGLGIGLSIHLSVIGPLPCVIQNSQNAKLSEEAMTPLKVRPRRECPWDDSMATARVAREQGDHDVLTLRLLVGLESRL